MIVVERKTDREFLVIVKEDDTKTEQEHIVSLDEDYYQYLSQEKITKEELIQKSFEFLLKKESKESILSRFNLKVIERYFPEYEEKIRIIGKTMKETILEKKVGEILARIMHPEIDYSLVDLGVIKNVVVKDNGVTLTLKLPLLEVPIKDLLVNSIKEELEKLNVVVKINTVQMNEEERAKFMKMSQEKWRF